jgi:hypothetical protein
MQTHKNKCVYQKAVKPAARPFSRVLGPFYNIL